MAVEMDGIVGRFYKTSEFIMKLLQLQLLWIFFSFVGLLVVGIMPATMALFATTRKWVMKREENFSLFKEFWKTFRNEFWKSNLIGFLLSLMGYALYVNLSIMKYAEGILAICLFIGVILCSLLFITILIYIVPVFVHYNLKLSRYFTYSLMIGISYPVHTILVALIVYIVSRLFFWIPGLLPFFSMSLPAYLIMVLSLKLFERIERRRESEESISENFSNMGQKYGSVDA